MNACCIIATR